MDQGNPISVFWTSLGTEAHLVCWDLISAVQDIAADVAEDLTAENTFQDLESCAHGKGNDGRGNLGVDE